MLPRSPGRTLGGALLLAAALAPSAAADRLEPVGVEMTPAQRQLAQDTVARKLKDPTSAVFEGLVARPDPNGRSLHVCGWVNAKNSFGGYTGRIPFYTIVTEGEPDGVALIDQDRPLTLVALCSDYGLPLD